MGIVHQNSENLEFNLMDTRYVLDTLASGKPLFTFLPLVPRPRIIGTESEYGVATDPETGHSRIDQRELPMILKNGGEAYVDIGHLEYASPEVADPVSGVAFYEAGKAFCFKKRFSKTLLI